MLKLFFYTLLVFFQSYVIQDIDKHQVKNLLNNEVTVIDVRTEKEFKEGNIKTSFNLDFQKREFIDSLEKLDKSGDLSYLDGIENQFTQMRYEFERVYSKTRVVNKSEDYILDQDHHHHPANQTINFDWQFLGEIMVLNKIKKTYNYEKI